MSTVKKKIAQAKRVQRAANAVTSSSALATETMFPTNESHANGDVAADENAGRNLGDGDIGNVTEPDEDGGDASEPDGDGGDTKRANTNYH